MNKDIINNKPAIMAAIGKLCCTVDPTLRLPIYLGINVPPNNPIEKIMPKRNALRVWKAVSYGLLLVIASNIIYALVV